MTACGAGNVAAFPTSRRGSRPGKPSSPGRNSAHLRRPPAALRLRLAERLVALLDFLLRWRVVRVDLRRLDVRVPQVLLQRPQRDASRGQSGRERMPQVVEADLPNLRVDARLLEATRDLR